MFCTKCGTQNDDDDKFCQKCGAVLKAAKTVQEQPATPPREVSGEPAHGFQSGYSTLFPPAAPAQEVNNEPARGFQPGYGAPLPPVAPARRRRKGLFIGVAAAAVVVVGIITVLLLPKTGAINVNNGLALNIKETSFSTPEAAVRQFVKSASANDLDGALSACAINEPAQKYDAEAWINRIEAIEVPGFTPAPTQYKYYKTLNQVYFLGRITSNIEYFTYSFEDSGVVKAVVGGDTYTTEDKNAAEKFVKAVNPENIKGLSIVRIDEPSPEILNNAMTIKNYKINAEIYGADAMTDRVALYKLNGKYFYGGFTLLHYNKSWKILDLTSSIAGTPANGSVSQTTVDEYSSVVK